MSRPVDVAPAPDTASCRYRSAASLKMETLENLIAELGISCGDFHLSCDSEQLEGYKCLIRIESTVSMAVPEDVEMARLHGRFARGSPRKYVDHIGSVSAKRIWKGTAGVLLSFDCIESDPCVRSTAGSRDRAAGPGVRDALHDLRPKPWCGSPRGYAAGGGLPDKAAQ
ncbi:hypothetical protein EVAR_60067_1 [Eumeta japonica]|uniref:Uncharacterized protein n=1 Tax=Eumeta variegata TaxID=151549 RepID=A0A4C1ZND2_EUMVA|nr:hypothetical protein EVAR_60067_1 [Eumeta japonica]